MSSAAQHSSAQQHSTHATSHSREHTKPPPEAGLLHVVLTTFKSSDLKRTQPWTLLWRLSDCCIFYRKICGNGGSPSWNGPILTPCCPPPHALRIDNCSMQMVGFDNTFFGVGGPEVVVVLVVGYFVLGPVELVKLVKQAGILVGQLRDAGLGTVTNLSTIMDDQVCMVRRKLSAGP